MFESCSIMVMCADDQQSIKRLEIDADTQKCICNLFENAANEMVEEKSRVEFDGRYKPEQDEILYIANFQLSDEIKDAIRDPMGVAAYGEVNGNYPGIKSILVGFCKDEDNAENFCVSFQRFRREQYISAKNVNLFWSKNTFLREEGFGISISDTIDCYYAGNNLFFKSFFFARQVFDLSGYYRSATNQEVSAFTSNSRLIFENADAFGTMANTQIRRKIALINDSGVLQNYTAQEIKRLAGDTGIDVSVKDDQVVIPNDKEKIKVILGFLDEEAYKGPFSQMTFLANSKRPVKK